MHCSRLAKLVPVACAEVSLPPPFAAMVSEISFIHSLALSVLFLDLITII
jgi:hypothetical protein